MEKQLDIQLQNQIIKGEMNQNEMCSLDLASEKISNLKAVKLKLYFVDITKSGFRDDTAL